MSFSQEIVSIIHGLQDQQGFREEHWEGSFADYLQIVSENPKVARTAFQRVYDMIVSHGVAGYTENKKSDRFEGTDNLAVSRIEGREHIFNSIRTFLGKGR